MNKRFFVVSDIHGMYNQFIELLKNWNREDCLVVLGDMIDRGPDSLKVVQEVMKLSANYEVIALMGNHDKMMLDFIESPKDNSNWLRHGGLETIRSFLGDEVMMYGSKDITDNLLIYNKKEVDFIKNLNYKYIFDKLLFTHAGFCSWFDDIKFSSDDDLIWVRDHYKFKNQTQYVNIFGHTPTRNIDSTLVDGIWVSNDASYIGIDGASCFGGQLNGLLIDSKGAILDTYSVNINLC